jgi:hypothetical protein
MNLVGRTDEAVSDVDSEFNDGKRDLRQQIAWSILREAWSIVREMSAFEKSKSLENAVWVVIEASEDHLWFSIRM